jgi:glycerol-3-phosphate acyltransferase PlsX
MTDEADVVVTDGFTGNVALKTLEGALKTIVANLLGAFDATEATREASAVLWPALLPLYAQLDPENTGGAMLLGVDGVCIISHGSSSAVAMVNAIRVARDMVAADVVGNLRSAISADKA